MNMLRKGLSSFVILIAFSAFSQFSLNAVHTNFLPKKKWLKVSVTKTGPYFGYQRGKYNVGELGVEGQYKQIKLSKSITHAGQLGFNYNFTRNVLGCDLGYWVKPSRLGLTYGARLVFRTDFDRNKMGLAPVIGYKLYGFHLQTGYYFLSNSAYTMETNTFFVSLRFTLVNNRDVDVDKKRSLFERKKSK
jgi:hypothetical protein